MRNLFSGGTPDPNAPAPVAGAASGWNGLSGRAKVAILGGVAAASMAAILWPSWNTGTAPPQTTQATHPAAPIKDYEPAPTVQDVTARAMGGTPAAVPVRTRPIPTEMALYTAPKPAVVAAAAPGAAPGAPAADTSGLPPTNRATLVKHPDFLIRAGDLIPCLPVGHQNSEKPGFETCQVPTWFRSTNQQRGLLPPHSRLFGQMRTGMQAGEQRIGIAYSLIQTPNFNMPVASPAGDPLGAAGLDKVDVQTFFWDRAGAVALYALMDTTVGIGQNVASSALSRSFNNGTGTTLNFTGPSQSLAAREFDATINRPPIGTRAPALPITVTVGQDLDFYDACMQAMRVDPMACPRQ